MVSVAALLVEIGRFAVRSVEVVTAEELQAVCL